MQFAKHLKLPFWFFLVFYLFFCYIGNINGSGVRQVYTKQSIKDIVSPIFDKYPIKQAFIFGSYARGDYTEYSDIDILLELRCSMGLGFGSLYQDIKEALGIHVDICTTQCLDSVSNEFKGNVERDRWVIYEYKGTADFGSHD